MGYCGILIVVFLSLTCLAECGKVCASGEVFLAPGAQMGHSAELPVRGQLCCLVGEKNIIKWREK